MQAINIYVLLVLEWVSERKDGSEVPTTFNRSQPNSMQARDGYGPT